MINLRQVSNAHVRLYDNVHVRLCDLDLASTATITHINTTLSSAQVLSNLGVVAGATIQVVGRAPLGDPLILDLGESRIALRRNDARDIYVTRAREVSR